MHRAIGHPTIAADVDEPLTAVWRHSEIWLESVHLPANRGEPHTQCRGVQNLIESHIEKLPLPGLHAIFPYIWLAISCFPGNVNGSEDGIVYAQFTSWWRCFHHLRRSIFKILVSLSCPRCQRMVVQKNLESNVWSSSQHTNRFVYKRDRRGVGWIWLSSFAWV